MEASALTPASRAALFGRRSPLLRLHSDERLIESIRVGQEAAFEVLMRRYRARLLAYCQHMLRSREDAEDVLQEVFAAAHSAMLADVREINARPWLYRIARNRCLNHLRKPVADGQDSMDVLPHANGATAAEVAQERADVRQIFADVHELPEAQRTALVLREIDDLPYEEIAVAMGTTVSAVKSLLVRARMGLAEASEARLLTCDEVRLQYAEAAEGLRKPSGAAKHHVRECAECTRYRKGMRQSAKALAALAPIGLLGAFKEVVFAKLGGGGAGSSAGTGGAAAGGGGSGCAAGATGGAAAGAGGAAAGSGVAGSGMVAAAGAGGAGALAGGVAASGLGSVLGGKAAAGVATAALLTAGAAGVADQIGIRAERGDVTARSAPATAGGEVGPADRVAAHPVPAADDVGPALPATEPGAQAEQGVAAGGVSADGAAEDGRDDAAGPDGTGKQGGEGTSAAQPPPAVGEAEPTEPQVPGIVVPEVEPPAPPPEDPAVAPAA